MPVGRPGLLGDGRRASTPPTSATRLTEGGLDAAFLVNADPVRDFAGRARPGARRSPRRTSWSRSRCSRTPRRRHADVVFPAESYAEKEGTVTHPDGRLQRAAPGSPAPGPRASDVGGARRALRRCSATRPGSTRSPTRSPRSPPRSPSTPGSPRGDRRHAACAGRSATRPRGVSGDGSAVRRIGGSPAPDAPASRRRAPPRAPTATSGPREVTERSPALRFLRPEADDRARARGRRAARARRAATRSTSAPTGRACGRGSRSASGCGPAPGFLIEGTATEPATLVGEDVEITNRRETTSDPAARRHHLRRGDLDPDRQVDRDLRRSSSRSSRC